MAVGEKGSLLTSPDGSGWTILMPGTINHLSDVAYGGGTFVAVGDKGMILTSPDGASWTKRPSKTKVRLSGIAYGDDAFLAVGPEGTSIKSGVLSSIVTQASPSNSHESLEIILWIGKPNMLVNGANMEIDLGRGTKPVIVDNRTLTPIRAIVENLGGKVNWDGAEEKISIQLKGTAIDLWIGKNTARINGVEKTMDVAPLLMNDRTMLPLRFVSENLGCKVSWEENTGKITVEASLIKNTYDNSLKGQDNKYHVNQIF